MTTARLVRISPAREVAICEVDLNIFRRSIVGAPTVVAFRDREGSLA